MEIRKPTAAGTFYPQNKNDLEKTILSLLDSSKKVEIKKKVKGLIVPHAGYLYSGTVAAAGYNLLQNQKIERVILLGPSHYIGFEGAALSEAEFFETPLGKIKLFAPITVTPPLLYFDAAHQYEHSLEVQLPFLQIVLKNNFKLLPICLGEVDEEKLAEVLIPEITDNAIVIASSDLSHFFPYDEAVKIDSIANAVIPALEIDKAREELDACGKKAILTLMYLAKKLKWQGKFIDYKNSGDTFGDKSRVVGYGCYAFY
jgi:AmmeMemoRadiSam system protein B